MVLHYQKFCSGLVPMLHRYRSHFRELTEETWEIYTQLLKSGVSDFPMIAKIDFHTDLMYSKEICWLFPSEDIVCSTLEPRLLMAALVFLREKGKGAGCTVVYVFYCHLCICQWIWWTVDFHQLITYILMFMILSCIDKHLEQVYPIWSSQPSLPPILHYIR